MDQAPQRTQEPGGGALGALGGRGAGVVDDAGPVGGAGGTPRAAAVRVDVRYFAGAAAAAGLEQEVVLLEDDGADGADRPGGGAAGGRATLAALLEQLRDVHPALGPVLEVATALVDEVAVTDRTTVLRDGAQVDVLPPFAGG